MKARNYIITGAPGTGKTSIIEGLRQRGVNCFGEVAREVIIRETVAQSDALPFKDVLAFTEKVVREMKDHLTYCEQFDLNIFDRGLPDSAGYLMLENIDVPEYLVDEIKVANYQNQVFFTPFWPDIYTTDSERFESVEHAQRISKALEDAYSRFGFELVKVPKGPISTRVEFIYQKIQAQSIESALV